MTLPPNVTYSPPSLPADAAGAESAAKDDGKYQELVITRPKMNETVRSNIGEVPVEYSLTPAGLKPGHRYRVILDGKSLEEEFTAEQIVLQRLVRGSHTVQIHAVDAAGVPQISSQSVVFFLRQESELDTGGDDTGTTDNTEAYQPDFAPDSAEDQASEYEDTESPTYEEGIPENTSGSDFGTEVTDPEDSRETVYDPTYNDNTTSSGNGDRFKAGTDYTPNYKQQ